ncbi:FMN-linked oxidoreductase [Cylindrobasidium torrendii FP15055 ss-10]|uniref:FMN-linked oxidoreductase n=1 Tax=Cylindrobasidium torrendii FP15055 ss-10 TaxID=1314674 RepID=A0A0D7BBZ5_9AGAR|nr:FMN-linked oxidoreductase [Cylindrobasidium torrendii FP15055 ss-10]
MSTPNLNPAAPNVSFFTPLQEIPAGTARAKQNDDKPIPSLFQPLTIRGMTVQNRIWVSPMDQYSADNGLVTPWHHAHLGGIISRGPGLTWTEASAVLPEGRISPEDAGIWSDEHAARWAPIVEFAHSQNQRIGIQLGHSGRKASTSAPWIGGGRNVCSAEERGWPDNTWAPSPISFLPQWPTPKELDIPGIERIVEAFKEAGKRAVSIGFDAIEIHGAHGYLVSTFLSPTSNQRTDKYGGSFENRTRFALEIVDALRSVMPDSMPLSFRISGTEGVEEVTPDEPSWTVEDTVRFAPILAAHGVDILDVSSYGINPKQRFPPLQPAYQAWLAAAVKKSNPGLLVTTVGGIADGALAQSLLDTNQADIVLCGRAFQQNPGLVLAFAQQLDVQIHQAHQIEWGYKMSPPKK